MCLEAIAAHQHDCTLHNQCFSAWLLALLLAESSGCAGVVSSRKNQKGNRIVELGQEWARREEGAARHGIRPTASGPFFLPGTSSLTGTSIISESIVWQDTLLAAEEPCPSCEELNCDALWDRCVQAVCLSVLTVMAGMVSTCSRLAIRARRRCTDSETESRCFGGNSSCGPGEGPCTRDRPHRQSSGSNTLLRGCCRWPSKTPIRPIHASGKDSTW